MQEHEITSAKGPMHDGSADAPGAVDRPVAAPTVPFYWTLPDHVRIDVSRLLAHGVSNINPGGQRITVGLVWLIHAAIIAQQRASIVLPDLLCYQALWGGDTSKWPANRRRWVFNTLQNRAASWMFSSVDHLEAKATAPVGDGEREAETRSTAEPPRSCPPVCPLYGTGLPHHHYRIVIRTLGSDVTWTQLAADEDEIALEDTFLGALEVFGDGDDGSRTYQWDLKKPPKVSKDNASEEEDDKEEQQQYRLIQQYEKKGRILASYLPTLVFSSAAPIRLSPHQRFLHRGITRELTRLPRSKKSERPDRAQIIVGGKSTRQPNEAAIYPGLTPDVCYVGFNGNGFGQRRKYHGRGYAIRTWMRRAAYPTEGTETTPFWTIARMLFDDFNVVADLFGLTVAAWHPKKKEWYPLSALSAMTRSDHGRRWLNGTRLRIYTPDDYLDRWRATLAERMGFSAIPRLGDEDVQQTGPYSSAAELRNFLSVAEVTRDDFALAVGVSKSQLSKRLGGVLKWSQDWVVRVRECLARHPEWLQAVAKNSH